MDIRLIPLLRYLLAVSIGGRVLQDSVGADQSMESITVPPSTARSGKGAGNGNEKLLQDTRQGRKMTMLSPHEVFYLRYGSVMIHEILVAINVSVICNRTLQSDISRAGLT